MKKNLNKYESNFVIDKQTFDIRSTKNYPSSTREWNNSIYTFNKNYLNLIPYASKLTMRLITNYFNALNYSIEKRVRKSRLRMRFRRFSSSRIYISNGVFKHTNDKVTITVYIFNRQKVNYSFLIRKKFKRFLMKKLTSKLLYLRDKVYKYIEKEEINKLIVVDILDNQEKTKYIEDYEKLYKKLIKRVLKRYKKYFLYKQLLYINKSKFNYNYLSYLTYLLKKIYKKDVQFDIVNLKNFYLNSDIFTQSILFKIKKNRRKLVGKLKRLILKSKINKISRFITYKPAEKNTLNSDQGSSNYLILNNLYKNKKSRKLISAKSTVLSLIKYKKVTGVRIEAHGRLTKRYAAARAVSKFRYKGNLINLNSSFLGISSVLLRGNLRSNLQYTKLKSKTRIGSFGLKGWVSAY